MSPIIQHVAYPTLLLLGFVVTWLCYGNSLAPWLMSTIAVAAMAAIVCVGERCWPGREDCVGVDQPILFELTHVIAGWLFGYGTAVWLCTLLGELLRSQLGRALWPSDWALVWQVPLACLIAEGTSYWQHRFFHRFPSMWRFHKLHHLGSRLTFVRSGRFHFVDLGVAAFFEWLPLIILGTPAVVLAWISAITGFFGVVQHANIQMKTPPWMTLLIVTPDFHRVHHSSSMAESDSNYGTVTTIFDIVFGTYRQPTRDWPDSLGVAGELLPKGIGDQLWPAAGESQ